MTKSLSETVNTLRGAHNLLQHEMNCLARPSPLDAEALRRLRDMARSLQEQAHSLLVTMAYQEVSENLHAEAEDLVRVFGEAVVQLEVMLVQNKPSN